MEKTQIKLIAYSIGARSQIDPPNIVASQLKTFTAEGMAMKKVMKLKIVLARVVWPEVNMWWPHTRNPSSAIANELMAMKA